MQKKYYGTVIRGYGRGRILGFPTININLVNNELDLENGVYAVRVDICRDGACPISTTYKGMIYIGTRPTFNMREKSIEIHLFNFNEDLYDQQISFQILQKIRDEIHFESVENLIKQLHHDKEMVYNYFQTDINS